MALALPLSDCFSLSFNKQLLSNYSVPKPQMQCYTRFTFVSFLLRRILCDGGLFLLVIDSMVGGFGNVPYHLEMSTHCIENILDNFQTQ